MDLIINPTNKCNFSCDFCSARNLPNRTLTSKETITFLKKLASLGFTEKDEIVKLLDITLGLCFFIAFYAFTSLA